MNPQKFSFLFLETERLPMDRQNHRLLETILKVRKHWHYISGVRNFANPLSNIILALKCVALENLMSFFILFITVPSLPDRINTQPIVEIASQDVLSMDDLSHLRKSLEEIILSIATKRFPELKNSGATNLAGADQLVSQVKTKRPRNRFHIIDIVSVNCNNKDVSLVKRE